MLIFIEVVEHGNEGASSHERIVPCLMTAITLNICLHMFVVDIGIGLQQFFVEAGFIERF